MLSFMRLPQRWARVCSLSCVGEEWQQTLLFLGYRRQGFASSLQALLLCLPGTNRVDEFRTPGFAY